MSLVEVGFREQLRLALIGAARLAGVDTSSILPWKMMEKAIKKSPNGAPVILVKHPVMLYDLDGVKSGRIDGSKAEPTLPIFDEGSGEWMAGYVQGKTTQTARVMLIDQDPADPFFAADAKVERLAASFLRYVPLGLDTPEGASILLKPEAVSGSATAPLTSGFAYRTVEIVVVFPAVFTVSTDTDLNALSIEDP